MTKGFGVLEISTNESFSSDRQAFEAGYLEVHLTGHRIIDHFRNLRDTFVESVDAPFSEDVLALLRKQYEWFEGQVEANTNADSTASGRSSPGMSHRMRHQKKQQKYWKTARFVLQQFKGEVAGIENYFVEHRITNETYNADPWQIAAVLNAAGDMMDIMCLNEAPRSVLRRHEGFAFFKMYSTGSGFTRLFGFEAWTCNLVHSMSFSSYPGTLVSLDDYYLMSSGLAMIQTSLTVGDPSIRQNLTMEALLAWQRVRIANHLAKGGRRWFELLQQYNSGTYSNQYTVVDFKRFTPRKELKKGLLWVIESVPGLTVGKDMTEVLKWGYWGSYNAPYFPEVRKATKYEYWYNISGMDKFSFSLTTRGKVLRRDSHEATKTSEVMDLAQLIRRNRYKTDPLLNGDVFGDLCARGDLRQGRSVAIGCFDSKATNYSWGYQHMRTLIQSGPPVYGDDLKPFNWNEFDNKSGAVRASHRGLPNEYNFSWAVVEPKYKLEHDKNEEEEDD
ncbi:phospholipase B domain containing [Perkinsus chesapeaki]|uniref:Phospholipase B-like n=1 Tax=Perkinsus chesapeaki TaxID=330153 RepID=A0A7J6MQJ0_PERCH|nr:phospholipase B domain containing [Perkinsus chesapeaki]